MDLFSIFISIIFFTSPQPSASSSKNLVLVTETDTLTNSIIRARQLQIDSLVGIIESTKIWTRKDSFSFDKATTAYYYYKQKNLLKITTEIFGENSKSVTTYFLHQDKLAFVHANIEEYNRPYYYDSAAMKENNDTEAFDPNKSKLTTINSYFESNIVGNPEDSGDGSVAYSQDQVFLIGYGILMEKRPKRE